MSLSLNQGATELLVGSSTGKVLRSFAGDLSTSIISEGHIDQIAEVSFKKGTTDYFATLDYAGIILVWDINTLGVVTRCSPSSLSKPKGRCLCIADDDTIVSGWEDGFIRCFEITKSKTSGMKWEIVNAHRGAVTCVYAVLLVI